MPGSSTWPGPDTWWPATVTTRSTTRSSRSSKRYGVADRSHSPLTRRRRLDEIRKMKTSICKMLGAEFPLVAFSHCRDVIAAVSRAGGFGVLGVTGFTPEELDVELGWIDEHIDGKPYGVDVLIPENLAIRSEKGVTARALAERIPQGHKDFVRNLLGRYEVDAPETEPRRDMAPSVTPDEAMKRLEVAFRHPIRLIANALGVPPQEMIDLGHQHGVP